MEEQDEKPKEEKKTIFVSLPKLRGKDRYETIENYSILLIIIGAVMLSSGMLIAGFNPFGLGPILLMMGTLISFLSTVVLIFTWLTKEFFSD